jgi:anion-transporting  ArsA/GET3 family ATPase
MLHAAGQHDLIVLDTPPTANAIDFLEAPGRVREIVTNPAARLLAGSGRLGMKIMGLGGGVFLKTLESLGGGPFVADLGVFLREFSEILSEFRRRAGDFENLMRSEETAVVLATGATDFGVREAADFLEVLREHHMSVAGVVLNRVDPPVPPMPADDRLRSFVGTQLPSEDVDAMIAGLESAHRAAIREAEAGRKAREQLVTRVAPLPVIAVPRQVPPPATLADLRAIGDALLG